jgi:hypothetical protein
VGVHPLPGSTTTGMGRTGGIANNERDEEVFRAFYTPRSANVSVHVIFATCTLFPKRAARRLATTPSAARDAPRVVSRAAVGRRGRSRPRRQGRASRPARRAVVDSSDPSLPTSTRCPPRSLVSGTSRADRLGDGFLRGRQRATVRDRF